MQDWHYMCNTVSEHCLLNIQNEEDKSMFSDLLSGSIPLTKQSINPHGSRPKTVAEATPETDVSGKSLFLKDFSQELNNSSPNNTELAYSETEANSAVNIAPLSSDVTVSSLLKTLETSLRDAIAGKTLPIHGNELPHNQSINLQGIDQRDLTALQEGVFEALFILDPQVQNALKNNSDVSLEIADSLKSIDAIFQNISQLNERIQVPQNLAGQIQNLNKLASHIATLKESFEKVPLSFSVNSKVSEIASLLEYKSSEEAFPLLSSSKAGVSQFTDLNLIQANKAASKLIDPSSVSYYIPSNTNIKFFGESALNTGSFQKFNPTGLENQSGSMKVEKINPLLNAFSDIPELNADKTMLTKNTVSLDAKLSAFGELLQQNVRQSQQAPVQSSSQVNQLFTAQINLPVANPQWGNQFVQRLSWIASQGISTAELQLNPAELGPLHVRIESAENAARVSFAVQHPATREALESQLPKLRDMFSDQGLSLLDIENNDFAGEEPEHSHSEEYFDGEDTDSVFRSDDTKAMAEMGDGLQANTLTLHYGLIDAFV